MLSFALLLSAVAGCDNVTHPDHAVRLLVYGTVRDRSSEPVAGVTVRAQVHRNNDCSDPSFLTGSAVTNAAGGYGIDIFSFGRTFSACVDVTPVPVPPPPYLTPRARGVQMKESLPPDSLRADLYVDPSAAVP